MKRIFLLTFVPFIFHAALSAQITQEQADTIVLQRMTKETRPWCMIYGQDTVQPSGTTIKTAKNETLEFGYPYWLYYVGYIEDTDEHTYFVIRESDGNLLVINTKNDTCPNNLETWRLLSDASECDCTSKLFRYLSGNKQFLYSRLIGDCLLVGFDNQVLDGDIKDYINQTGLFDTVNNNIFDVGTGFKLVLVNTVVPKTCFQLSEIISLLYESPIVVFASFTFETSGTWNTLSYTTDFIVSNDNNLSDLQAIAIETNTYIKSYNSYHYILSVDKNSNGDALQMANYFYETGKFSYAEPDFLMTNR